MSFIAPSERLFLPESVQYSDLCDDEIQLEGATASHLTKVLRVRTGEELWLGDGKGAARKGRVSGVSKRSLSISFAGEVRKEAVSTSSVVLALAMLQNREDLERATSSAVEAGVDRILIFRSERSNRPVPDLQSPQGQRLSKIIREASSQSRRVWIPEVETVPALSDVLIASAQLFVASPEAPQDQNSGTATGPQDLIVVVGPEGGFSEEEQGYISASNAESLWLGPAVLRARTAAALAVHRLVLIRGNPSS